MHLHKARIKFFLFIIIITRGLYPHGIDFIDTSSVHMTPIDTVLNAHKDSLSVTAADSLKLYKKKTKTDSLVHIYQNPLYQSSNFIDNYIIKRTDYRYTGDLFKSFPFTFVKDYGFVGQPNEVFLYGAGFKGISYFENGQLYNSRLTNSLDLNNVQSESIDSIEILPSTRGFLYGPFNNAVSVNFINKDLQFHLPYSKIKYYQGPYGEALVDVLYNMTFYRKFIATFDITNRKVDNRYYNSSFGIWQTKVNLKYLLSEKFNLQGAYGFVNSKVGINGGVNVDSILQTTSNVDSVLYNGMLAPVYFLYQFQKFKSHNFSLRLLGKPLDKTSTDLSFYYNFNLFEKDNNHDSTFFKTSDKSKNMGLSLKQNYDGNFFYIRLLGNYESTDLSYSLWNNGSFETTPVKRQNYSAASVFSLIMFDSSLVPSAFYKFTDELIKSNSASTNRSLHGMGLDVTYNLSDMIRVYFGYSSYENSESNGYITNTEISAELKSDLFFINLKYFNRKGLFIVNKNWWEDYYNFSPKNLTGFGASIKLNYWKVDFETSNSFYIEPDHKPADLIYSLPKLKSITGIYYKDILFNSNLDLKAGFTLYYTGKQASYLKELNHEIPSSTRLDFTVAGEIQKVAMVYFAWENLFDNNYYITPYYPMPERSIRFGVSWELFN